MAAGKVSTDLILSEEEQGPCMVMRVSDRHAQSKVEKSECENGPMGEMSTKSLPGKLALNSGGRGAFEGKIVAPPALRRPHRGGNLGSVHPETPGPVTLHCRHASVAPFGVPP